MNQLFSLIHGYIPDELYFQMVITVLIIVFTLALSKIISFIIRKILKPVFEKTENEFDDQILLVIESAIFRLLIVAGIYYASQHIENALRYITFDTHESIIAHFPVLKTVFRLIDGLLYTLFVVILLLMSFQVTNIAFDWSAKKINAEGNRNLSGSLFPLLKKICKILLTGFAVAVVLSKFDVNISGFIVSLGVGSLAIALAAQETISNMISGFIIMTDRPFRIGDRIRYANTEVGDVVEIGIRSTKIMDFDSNIVIIPNNEIVKSRIVNYNYPQTLTRVVIDAPVAYNTDFKKAKEILLKIASENPEVSVDPKPEVYITELGDYAVNLKLVMKTEHYKNSYNIQCAIREAILEEFKKEQIEIPYPQSVVYVNNNQM